MDIYQRRRLTAVGVFVAFITVIAIAAGSGGGDSTAPVTTGAGPTGASGASGAQPLSKADYIAQADSICGRANSSIANESGVGTAVPDPGVPIRQKAYNQLKSLQAPAQGAADLKKFLGGYKSLVTAVKKRETANKTGSATSQAEAGSDIDAATSTIESAGSAYGFKVCNSLSATSGSSAKGSASTSTGTDTSTGAGTVAPATPSTTTPSVAPTVPPAGTTPPVTGGTTPPDTAAGTGGDNGGSGGVTP